MQALRRLSAVFDSVLPVPGTKYRVGLDPILGLIPVVGDMVSPLFAIAVLWQARDLGIPKVVQLRMVFNVAIDSLFGIVPLVGDLFDFAWKANDRNMRLLEQHASEERPPTKGDWAFVVLVTLVVIALAALPFFVFGAIVAWLRTLV